MTIEFCRLVNEYLLTALRHAAQNFALKGRARAPSTGDCDYVRATLELIDSANGSVCKRLSVSKQAKIELGLAKNLLVKKILKLLRVY